MIIKNESALHTIRDYIQQNPERWLQDEEHPQHYHHFTELPLNLNF